MIDPEKAAVVMIDMQNGFIHERSPLHIAGARATVDACACVLNAARRGGMTIVHAVRRYAADGSDVEPCRYDAWLDGQPLSEGCDPAIDTREPSELAPSEGDLTVVKPSFSAFFETNLHEILRDKDISTVVLIGTTTPNCIRSTCYDALSYGYNVAVVEDATSSRTAEVQAANIADMAFIGAFVLSSGEFTKHLLANMDDTARRVRESISRSARMR